MLLQVTLALGYRDVWKILRYDIQELVTRGGLKTAFNQGTVITVNNKLAVSLIKYPIITFVIFFVVQAMRRAGYPADPMSLAQISRGLHTKTRKR